MKEPKITEKIGGYLLDWEDTALSIVIKRLDVHGDGRVTGDLQISNSSREDPIILLPSTQFNFSAERTRSMTAKQLKEKYPDSEINFVELFDFLGYRIQELARSGEPAEEIWSRDDVPDPELLVDPLLIKNVSNIIFGEKGVSKSTLCYAIGGILSVAMQDNPLGLEISNKPTPCLVLDWETDKGIFQYYLARLMRGTFGGKPFQLFYRRCRLPLVEEIEAIEKYIQQTGAEVLIIDSLAAAAGGENSELKGSQSSLQFNSALRKINKTSLIIAQTSKQQDTGRKSIYGSTLFTYYARNIFELCRGEDDNSDTVHLGLFHRESNLGRKHTPIGFSLKYDDVKKSISIERESVDVGEFAQKVTTGSRILDALKRGAMNAEELKTLLGIDKRNTIDQAISRLRKINKVIKVGEKWGLPAM